MSHPVPKALVAAITAAALFIAGAAFARTVSITPDPPAGDARLKQLLRDRLAVRKQIADRYEKLRARGGATNVEGLGSTPDILWAELDLTAGKAERVAVLERIVEHEKKITAFFERTPDFPDVD